MSITIDSNAPYATSFGAQHAEDAVYMSAEDPLLGEVLAVVYKSVPSSTKMSVILLGNHGTSGYVDMTLDASSRYYGACRGLAAAHYASPVRKALAIAALRTFATMDKPLRRYLLRSTFGELYDEQAAFKYYDEAAAGALGSRFRLVHGKFPSEIGKRILEAGFLEAKRISTGNIDIIYEDSDFTIDQNNDLVYMLGDQLEQLFDPLSEYSPEPTEKVYTPPTDSLATLEDDTEEVREICEELYILQSHVRSDLVALLQEFLIPLRVRVLSGEIPELTIGILNTLFPPTIDEVFRITNLFYDALQQALPFGSFEVLRACGTTIPYFYRASMRHEAATRNFTRNLTSYSPELQSQMEHFSPQRIESIMRFSLHLARTKMILDRLMRCRVWSDEEKQLANEYYAVADSTIHSFGMQQSVSEAYNRRVFTPTGKLLVEIAEGWPTELEYGWMSRRVVTIFDAVDIIEENSARRQLHHIVILFTDAVLILEPAAPIPMASMSGLHIPAVGDMLMHAVVNEAPLDKNLPPLRVVAWAPVLEVVFASFGDRSLVVSMPGGDYTLPSGHNSAGTASASHFYSKVYKLVRTDHVADKFVELLAKAKVTTKTQPFHLFRMAQQELQLYMTVHEGHGFNEEVNRFPLAIFLNCDISAATLKQHQLVGAVSLSFCGQSDDIRVKVVSTLGHQSDRQICRDDSREYVLSEVSYLATLALSSQNADALQPIVSGNATMVASLCRWAQAPPQREALGHRRGLLTPNTNNAQASGASPDGTAHPNMTPSRRISSPEQKQRRLRKVPHLDNGSANDHKLNTDSDYYPAAASSTRTLDRQPSLESANGASNDSLSTGSHYEFPPRKSLDGTRNSSRNSHMDDWESMDGDSIDDLDSADEAEQRDVDAWYHHISRRGASSLSSGVSDIDLGGSSPSTLRPIGNLNNDDVNDDESRYRNSPQSTSEAIQLGPFLTKSDSLLYNQHAGRAFAALADGSKASSQHNKNDVDSNDDSSLGLSSSLISRSSSLTESRRSTASISLSEQDDFHWLAEYVSDDAEVSRSSSMNKLYPGLRDPSIVRLGNYVLSSEKSAVWNTMPNPSLLSVAAPNINASVAPLNLRKHKSEASDASSDGLGLQTDFEYLRAEVQDYDGSDTNVDDNLRHDYLGSDEATPRLEDLHFSDSSHEEGPDEGVRNILRNSRWLAALSTNEANNRNSFEPPAQQASKPNRRSFVPRPQSAGSFSRMVMSSSLNSLQLASITVQLDQVIAAAAVYQRPLLTEVKNLLIHHYGATHQYAKSRKPSSPVDAQALREEEATARNAAAWCVWTLISLDKQNLVSPYLEIEWHRRTLLAESLGSELPSGLWA